MGAAITATTSQGSPSMAELFIANDSTDTADVHPLWSELTSSLPVGVSATSLTMTAGSSTSLEIWASGENMNVTTSISSGFSVSPTGCNLTAGTSCNLTVSPASAGVGSGTLTLTGPNGPQTVALENRVATSLSLSASGRTLVSGRKLSLAGRLTTSAGSRVGGQTVTLMQHPAGSRSSTAATGQTGADGSVTFELSPQTNTSYTLTFGGASGLIPSSSSSVTVTVSPKITVHVKRGVARGKVSPSLPGKRIALQRRRGRGWKTVASAKLGHSGTFSFPVSKPGAYRVSTPSSATNADGVSATFTVT
jgi:hypothetical protein